MPRPATGSVEWKGDPTAPSPDDHFIARITLPDKTRHRVPLPSGLSEDEAKDKAASLSDLARKSGAVALRSLRRAAPSAPDPAEAYRAWCERWLQVRRARGLTSVRNDKSRLDTHVFPMLGDRPIVSVTKTELEELVGHLDEKVLLGLIDWKTALNIWTLVTTSFADAFGSKNLSLRVRQDNPALGIAGPDRGVRRSKVYLFPNEFLKLVNCEQVPLVWRRCYAIAIYTIARAGELEALEWDSIYLDQGAIFVHQAVDSDTGKVKPTKGKETRRFALEPNVLPLLRVMRAEADPKAKRVVPPLPTRPDPAARLREYLRVAGVTRAELFITDATRKNLTFHDLRATGITWMAVRGDPALKIRHRAGHASVSTTEQYIREAEAIREGFGDVFPPLPACLLGDPGAPPDGSESPSGKGLGIGRESATNRPDEMVKAPEPLGFQGLQECEEGDLNPAKHVAKRTIPLQTRQIVMMAA